MAQTKLRDWAKELGVNVGYKDGQVTIGDLSFQQGQGGQFGIGFDGASSHYVANPNVLQQALGVEKQQAAPTEKLQAPVYEQQQPNFAQTIEDLYARERQARLLALQNQLQGQQSTLQRQKIALAPQFQQERVQTDTSAQMAGQRLAEMMANRGLDKGGENVTANIGLQTARQEALSGIGQRETTANAEIDQRVADLGVAHHGDLAQMEAALGSEQARAMLESQYRDRDFGYQQHRDNLSNYWQGTEFDYRKERDQVGDSRYDKEWDWQTDEKNPAYQRQMIDLEIARLTANHLPEQQKLELQQLKQNLQAGSISIATANQQLTNLKKGLTASGGGGSSSGGSVDPSMKPSEYVNQVHKLFPPDGMMIGEERLDAIKQYINNLKTSGVPEQTLVEVMRLLGIPISYK